MFGIAAEFEDVVLRDAQVFEQHPWGVREARRLGAAEGGRQALDDVVEFGMGMATGEKL